MCDTAAASQIKESRPETTIEFSTRLLSLLYSIQYKSDVMRSVRSPCHNKMQTTTTLHTLDIKSLAVNFAPASWEIFSKSLNTPENELFLRKGQTFRQRYID